MEKKIATLRNGSAQQMLTRLLVPGDVVLLVGGCEVPADIEWIEGDVLSVDTAALTGEPLPRKYPSDQYGPLILCGSTIRAGEAYGIVRKTGTNTEIGGAQADILQDKSHTKTSVFEERILLVVKIIIFIALIDVFIIFFIQGFAGKQFTDGHVDADLLTCLSIIIASIPIALPLVLQVTMALGAAKMATQFHCVVTSLPALQDISSMTVLCSDKTGTLTTARISILADTVWTNEGFTKEDVALYGALASSRDKKEDAIDRSVINHVDAVFGQDKAISMAADYTKVRGVGFNPIYKRVLFEYTHPEHGKLSVSKGLPNKVLDTADGGEDDAEDQWKCENFEGLKKTVHKVDYDFSKAGYKTLAVAIKKNDGPWQYVGILPMLDPPRHDTAKTIKNLVNAGIEVKMITGDHLNIAKETARLIGLGVNIHAGSEIRDGSRTTDELIHESNGFAQVLPKDKREVVLVLRDKYKYVVGMTGDGVNDAPALSAAQCGVAVDDATDAAKNAAAIILTSPGLSAIYAAVVESRRIFRKLKSYATYRFAATIQIVIVLTLLIYISNCSIDSFFIVLLALFNDVTMLPIAYDLQVASKNPEKPEVNKLLAMACFLGVLNATWTLLFAYFQQDSQIFSKPYKLDVRGPGYLVCETSTQALIWLQMFIATEILIFSARAQSYMWRSIRPSWPLIASVTLGVFIFCMLAGQSSQFGNLSGTDILAIIFYDLVTLVIVDVCKVQLLIYFQESTEILPDSHELQDKDGEGEEEGGEHDEENPKDTGKKIAIVADAKGNLIQTVIDKNVDNKREAAAVVRMQNIEIKRGNTGLNLNPDQIQAIRLASSGAIAAPRTPSQANLVNRLNSSIAAPRSNSSIAANRGASSSEIGSVAINQSIAPGATAANASGLSRGGLVSSGSLHPNTPGSLGLLRKSRARPV